MNALPHVIFTSGDEWNPTHPDHSLTDKEDWYNVIKDIEDGLLQTLFDEYGNYRNRTVPTPVTVLHSVPNSDIDGLPTGTDTPGIAAIPIDIDEDEDIHINFHDCDELHKFFRVSLN
jgi:hypothetical protein